MSLTNYRDISKGGSDTHAGFQLEFYCASCPRTWKSPFQPYRKAQFAGLIYKLAYFLNDRGVMFRASNAVANAGEHRAHDGALKQALELAEHRYIECSACGKAVCEDCWDTGARLCVQCASKGARPHGGHNASARADDDGYGDGNGGMRPAATASAVLKCPNCSCAIGGGRFCEECGFDMASTHKSCPGCGTLCARATRFCADCGHAF
jgi:hypothetical protein